jgi:hypothetical protein
MADTEQSLLRLYRGLGAADQATLLAFAEFLGSRTALRPPAAVSHTRVPVAEPEPIERPPGESVVAGLKRLAKTYPMLDKSEMLSATSDLVASRIMKGGDPAGTIDQLEQIFREHYEQLRAMNRD